MGDNILKRGVGRSIPLQIKPTHANPHQNVCSGWISLANVKEGGGGQEYAKAGGGGGVGR